jgi:aminoglycoside/choline kinase family phosphotransferase
VPPYDHEALDIETGLLTDWCWPFLKGEMIGDELRASFRSIWAPLFDCVVPVNPVWTLRDYHSPNLMWLPERQGIARVGLIDTQDAVLGHPAYDLVSMLQDARIDIPFAEADELLDRYCLSRRGTGTFDEAEFRLAFAILGAQRATKVLGIFARLSKRDGKHGYLQHIPRVSRYLERNLQHPALGQLKAWYDRHLPMSLRESRSA